MGLPQLTKPLAAYSGIFAPGLLDQSLQYKTRESGVFQEGGEKGGVKVILL